jgi:drug/metabolite transporter (DMT)-like permease
MAKVTATRFGETYDAAMQAGPGALARHSWSSPGPWSTPLSASSILAAIVTAVAVMFLQWIFRSQRVNSLKLAQVGWLYAVFAAVLVARQLGSPLG